jgi:uroporphyrinogen-III synthase
VLAAGLRARGARLSTPVAYRTLAPPGLRAAFEAACRAGFDLLLFASPSAVENLAAVAHDLLHGRPAAVLGPVTEQAARGAGLDVRASAQPSTIAGLLDAVERSLGDR